MARKDRYSQEARKAELAKKYARKQQDKRKSAKRNQDDAE